MTGADILRSAPATVTLRFDALIGFLADLIDVETELGSILALDVIADKVPDTCIDDCKHEPPG